MVPNFRRYPFVIRAYIKLKHQQVRGVDSDYQTKFLATTIPLVRKQNYFRQKFDELIIWYDEFTGMDEVRAAQRRVVEDEQRFRETQEERRKALHELTDIQNKLKDLYSELDNTSRGEERFVTLVTHEHKLLQEEKTSLESESIVDKKEKFRRAEKLERESFSALSTSVKLSHEKERAQSERTKYWSIIGSVLGTVIGILGSSINNHFKMNELKQLLKNSTNMQLVDKMASYIETNEGILQRLEDNSAVKGGGDKNHLVKVEELLKSLSTRLTSVEKSVKNLNEIGQKYVSKLEDLDTGNEEGVIVTVPVSSLEVSLKKEYTQTKMMLLTLAVLSIIMPIISKYS